MKYSLKRIFHNLCYNWAAYLIIMVNFMLGAGLFILCMNFEMTSARLLKECKQKSAEGVIAVSQWVSFEEWDGSEYDISYDTYLRLSTDERYADDLAMLLAQGFSTATFLAEKEQAFSTWLYFMNDNLFEYLYGFTRSDGVAYVGNTAYQNLLTIGEAVKRGEESGIIFIPFEAYIDGEILVLDGKRYSYEVVMPLEKETIMPGFTGRSGYNMAEVILLPIEEVYLPQPSHPTFTVTPRDILFFKYLNDEWREDLVAQQLRELNAANEKVTFKVEDEYLQLKRQLEDLSFDMDRWMLVAVSILLLSGVGCIGLMFLLLNKRRHFMAVSVAYGSTLRRIGMETIAELCIVLLSGGGLGILIVPVLKKCMVYQEELGFNPMGVIIVTAVALLFSVVSVLLGMHAIKAKEVAMTLKDE